MYQWKQQEEKNVYDISDVMSPPSWKKIEMRVSVRFAEGPAYTWGYGRLCPRSILRFHFRGYCDAS